MKHCLFVDDSRVMRGVACQILADMKFYAEEAVEGPAALNACRAQMPDVVLVNIVNSGGLDFVRALRRGKAEKQPIVIGTLVEHDVNYITEALSAGADEYLLKPLDRHSLTSKFAEIGLL